MTFLLGLLVLGCLGVAVEVLRRQIKSDKEFLEWLEAHDRDR